MMNYPLLLLVLLLLLLNAFTSIIHSRYYQKTLNGMADKSREGFLGVGMTRSLFKSRSIILLMTNVEGTIRECQVMSGLTIFTKFKRYSSVEGLNVNNLPKNIREGKYKDSMLQAIERIKIEMNKG